MKHCWESSRILHLWMISCQAGYKNSWDESMCPWTFLILLLSLLLVQCSDHFLQFVQDSKNELIQKTSINLDNSFWMGSQNYLFSSVKWKTTLSDNGCQWCRSFRKKTLPMQKWDTEFEDHICFMKLSILHGLRVCRHTLIMLFIFDNTIWIFGLFLLEIQPFFHLDVCVQKQ